MHGYGGPEVIRLDRIEPPEPGPGEVLVRVAATTFNPSEAGLRQGLLRSIVPLDLPYTMGLDLAGTTAEGDRVIGRLDGGAAAEHAVAPATMLVPVPDGVPLEDAAALPIAGLTAWQAVFEHAAVTAGQRVLVNGAGAIGRYAIQLARHAGAHVVAVTSRRGAAAAHESGAHRVVTGAGEIEPVDALIHLVPAEPAHAARIRPGGVLVSATTPAARLPAGPFRSLHFIVRNDTADLAALLALVAAGTVRIDIAGRRPLTDLAAVHAEAENRGLAGKTLLLP
ncbi:NADP-dependent oxidoreductase [Actinoplanes sp. NEAU-H7]|uniref:NADP-dependent oxidoreductase n=2 Tax=Actinoplanes flavus TaxID=2820290 RepID=A0ABS3UXQ5_9ACTN|nr:NADP-dependent oxidoreductase [Actinoplanes flavus]